MRGLLLLTIESTARVIEMMMCTSSLAGRPAAIVRSRYVPDRCDQRFIETLDVIVTHVFAKDTTWLLDVKESIVRTGCSDRCYLYQVVFLHQCQKIRPHRITCESIEVIRTAVRDPE